MSAKHIRKWIKVLSIGWMALGLVLVGLALGDVLSKSLFQKIFAILFVIYALVVTALTRFLYNQPEE